MLVTILIYFGLFIYLFGRTGTEISRGIIKIIILEGFSFLKKLNNLIFGLFAHKKGLVIEALKYKKIVEKIIRSNILTLKKKKKKSSKGYKFPT